MQQLMTCVFFQFPRIDCYNQSMGTGQSEVSLIGLAKGDGLRVLEVRGDSPLEGKLEPFFDFIIDAEACTEPERTPKDILSKLTDENKPRRKVPVNFRQLINENNGKEVSLKVVSTKFRNVRSVLFIPNNQWGNKDDILGLRLRKEKYDQVFETYYPVAEIHFNSPIKKAGIIERQYLIGCMEFKYGSINELLENLYDRYYDKEVSDKTVHFAMYNILEDSFRKVGVVLDRGWGGKGLLGGQFLEGNLNRFPKNLKEHRDILIENSKKQQKEKKIKNQIMESKGTSKTLAEVLRKNRSKKNQHLKNIKQILAPPPVRVQNEVQNQKEATHVEEEKSKMKNMKQNTINSIQEQQINSENKPNILLQSRETREASEKVSNLQGRVRKLEHTLTEISQYIQKMLNEQGEQQVQIMEEVDSQDLRKA